MEHDCGVSKFYGGMTPSPISWDEYFMRHVYLAASKSKDPRTKIGAVIVRDNSVIQEGFNGFPRGVDDNQPGWRERPAKLYVTEHGERNAILHCARYGIKCAGATLYTQGIPCSDCARAVIQAGIVCVVVHKQWMEPQIAGQFSARWEETCRYATEMFHQAGVKMSMLDVVLGVSGFVDGKVVQV